MLRLPKLGLALAGRIVVPIVNLTLDFTLGEVEEAEEPAFPMPEGYEEVGPDLPGGGPTIVLADADDEHGRSITNALARHLGLWTQ